MRSGVKKNYPRIISEDLERLYAISKELYSIEYYKAARITKEAAKIIEAISEELSAVTGFKKQGD